MSEFGRMVSEYLGVMGEVSCEMVVPRSLMVASWFLLFEVVSK